MTARKSMLKLVKLQSLVVAKCCKMRKIQPYEICKFCIIVLYYAREKAPLSAQMWCILPFSFYKILQVATKLGNANVNNFKMLFLAVVMDFIFLAYNSTDQN
jgi:hypothetical protein